MYLFIKQKEKIFFQKLKQSEMEEESLRKKVKNKKSERAEENDDNDDLDDDDNDDDDDNNEYIEEDEDIEILENKLNEIEQEFFLNDDNLSSLTNRLIKVGFSENLPYFIKYSLFTKIKLVCLPPVPLN